MYDTIKKIGGIGLFSRVEDEPYFSWQGCAMCNYEHKRVLGNDVYDMRSFASLEDMPDNYYEFRLCPHHLFTLYYGEE